MKHKEKKALLLINLLQIIHKKICMNGVKKNYMITLIIYYFHDNIVYFRVWLKTAINRFFFSYNPRRQMEERKKDVGKRKSEKEISLLYLLFFFFFVFIYLLIYYYSLFYFSLLLSLYAFIRVFIQQMKNRCRKITYTIILSSLNSQIILFIFLKSRSIEKLYLLLSITLFFIFLSLFLSFNLIVVVFFFSLLELSLCKNSRKGKGKKKDFFIKLKSKTTPFELSIPLQIIENINICKKQKKKKKKKIILCSYDRQKLSKFY